MPGVEEPQPESAPQDEVNETMLQKVGANAVAREAVVSTEATRFRPFGRADAPWSPEAYLEVAGATTADSRSWQRSIRPRSPTAPGLRGCLVRVSHATRRASFAHHRWRVTPVSHTRFEWDEGRWSARILRPMV